MLVHSKSLLAMGSKDGNSLFVSHVGTTTAYAYGSPFVDMEFILLLFVTAARRRLRIAMVLVVLWSARRG